MDKSGSLRDKAEYIWIIRHFFIAHCVKKISQKYIFSAVVLLIAFVIANSQPATAQRTVETFTDIDTSLFDSLKIDRIFIVGNKKTKEKIIKRELDFSADETISTKNLIQRIKRNEDNIFNTRLFLTVKISMIVIRDNVVDVIIRVAERWYLFPIPVFELADRNFHDWWVNQNHDLKRLELGLKLYQYNVRGMNETLKLTGQVGFTKRFQIAYAFPYIDKRQRIGLNLLFDYKLNKNINYQTVEHVYRFLDSRDWLKEQYTGGTSLTYRKSLYSLHTIGINYYSSQINDTIAELNPNYFKAGSDQQYFRIYYSYVYDKRDIQAYPLTGSYFIGRIEKLGLGIVDDVNVFGASVLFNRFIDIGKHFYFTAGVGGAMYMPQRQPYILYNSMGRGQFTLRGYELYVIEGPYFLQNKYTLRKRLFQTEQDLRNILSAKQFSRFHLALYLKTYFDMGYVKGYEGNDLNTAFTDQFIYGGGAGIDLVTFYDIVMRFEYSFNKAGESGFVFGIRSIF